MISTGIADLDELLGGGLPEKSSTLILGPPGVGKAVVGYQFIGAGIERGEVGIFVFTGRGSEDICKGMKSIGYDIEKAINSDRLWFIDCDGISKGKKVINIDLTESYDISNQIKYLLDKYKNGKFRIFMNIISPMLMVNEPDTVYTFVSDIFKRIKKSNASVMISIAQGMHDQKTVIALEDLCDVVIEMKLDQLGIETRRAIQIKETPSGGSSTSMHLFQITPKGIKFETGVEPDKE